MERSTQEALEKDDRDLWESEEHEREEVEWGKSQVTRLIARSQLREEREYKSQMQLQPRRSQTSATPGNDNPARARVTTGYMSTNRQMTYPGWISSSPERDQNLLYQYQTYHRLDITEIEGDQTIYKGNVTTIEGDQNVYFGKVYNHQ